MAQRATIENFAQATKIVKELGLSACDGWDGEVWKEEGLKAFRRAIEDTMEARIERIRLESIDMGFSDRRNGHYERHILTAFGDTQVIVPRTRTASAAFVLKAYARRTADIDHLILGCFVLGLSTRKVGEALLCILGERVSASTVSRVARGMDTAVEAFHKRKLKDAYRVVLLDGVEITRKTGAGAVSRPVLVAMGVTYDNKKEVIDFHLASSESEAEWEGFLTGLQGRGLKLDSAELICVDGGKGCLSALKTVCPGVPIQRCWAHKIRNITDKVKKKDAEAVKNGLRRIYTAKNAVKARKAAGEFARKWAEPYPKAVKCLRDDLDDLLAFFRFKDPYMRKATRTTNAIERRFREVRRRTRPMGVFSDRTSIERILYAVFTYENKKQGTATPFLMTQNS
jgi:transposase-like protein